MTSPLLTLPLRSQSECTAAAMDRLIASADWLVAGATATAANLDPAARVEALAFASLVSDAVGETLKAWKRSRENARDDARSWGKNMGGASL